MRKKIHLIDNRPHIYELEDMVEFIKNHKEIYIYGKGVSQEYLCKYLETSGFSVSGYVVTNIGEEESFVYRKMPIYKYDDVKNKENIGFILGLADKYYGAVISQFRKDGFTDYFVLTEYSKIGIREHMEPRTKENLTFEINLVDHCNLSCQMCDHFSQLSDKWFINVETLRKDITRMGELFDHDIAAISLLGGEPTLHPDIIECMKIVREQFPNTELIVLTNGTMLLKLEDSPNGNFWQACKDYNVHITVTVYPINIDYAAIEKKAEEYGVILAMSSDIHAHNLTRIVKTSDKHTMDLNGNVDKFYCVNCLYMNKFNVLKEGKLYMCPIAAHIDIFNKQFNQDLMIDEKDYLDIYEIDSWEEIAKFSSQYAPFCSYCDLKNWGHHSSWKSSNKEICEYV